MRRRDLLAILSGALGIWSLPARGEQTRKSARLAYFAPAANADLLAALREALHEFGYVEGRNLSIDFRYLGRSKSDDEVAAELVRLKPDVIVVVGTPTGLAAKRQTSTIPIILAPASDPLRSGLVTSLAHPEGNVTGMSLYGSELARKRMEVLTEAVAGIHRIAVLRNSGNPLHRFLWEDVERIGPPLGLQLRVVPVSDFNELPVTFSAMKRDGFDAFTHLSDAQFFSARRRINELAAAHRLPGVYEAREYVDDGGLISYGPNIPDLTRRAATFVVKVLDGAKPADLPIEQPTKFELVINLKTAKALGVSIPSTILTRADQVIE
jgi:putative tryptophan/tyrosine transport system substrate-binding protein